MERRDSTASQETFVSMQQLDPSPIESPMDLEKQLPEFPPPPPSSSYLGLSGSGHVIRLQKYSSYVFTIYTSFHITNTSIIPLVTRSLPESETYLLLTRPYYQSFPLEPLLITLPIATHILAGLALRIHRRNANLNRYGAANLPITTRLQKRLKVWPAVSWSSISGYVLAPLVLGHAFVNRILPWVYEGGSSGVGLGFVSHGFAKHPVVAWTGYATLVGVASGHFVWGAARWNGWIPIGTSKKANRRWWTINGASLAVAALWMAGGLGVIGTAGIADGWVGKGYDVLYSKIPLVGLRYNTEFDLGVITKGHWCRYEPDSGTWNTHFRKNTSGKIIKLDPNAAGNRPVLFVWHGHFLREAIPPEYVANNLEEGQVYIKRLCFKTTSPDNGTEGIVDEDSYEIIELDDDYAPDQNVRGLRVMFHRVIEWTDNRGRAALGNNPHATIGDDALENGEFLRQTDPPPSYGGASVMRITHETIQAPREEEIISFLNYERNYNEVNLELNSKGRSAAKIYHNEDDLAAAL
ncbi:hypothetical protein G7Y89_g11355 [Cudoniella acicularis]|uniref:Mitochondrial adapter protein MCP1 transmembrane domain-containing protein n=1 Tax=Cudoniella acicularis TaxID=354080 RepID=A0A8H4RDN0_9HELO|nr:hypothetical protein G7Y89_g11355 [Cudoniella acicularis]